MLAPMVIMVLLVQQVTKEQVQPQVVQEVLPLQIGQEDLVQMEHSVMQVPQVTQDLVQPQVVELLQIGREGLALMVIQVIQVTQVVQAQMEPVQPQVIQAGLAQQEHQALRELLEHLATQAILQLSLKVHFPHFLKYLLQAVAVGQAEVAVLQEIQVTQDQMVTQATPAIMV